MAAVTLTTDLLSRHGGRRTNQDFCDYRTASGATCWVIADGLGGHAGGEVASRLAGEHILESFRADPAISRDRLTGWLESANRALHETQQSKPELHGMRTTVVVLVSDGQGALWAHLGDSRLYHFRAGAVHCQTRDHSVPQAMAAAGEITSAEIRFHVDRNRLLRSLGDPARFRPAVRDGAEPIEGGDAFLLCTDGFWELVTEEEMMGELAGSRTPGEWLAAMERRVRAAMSGEDDNYSAIAVFVSSSARDASDGEAG